METILQGRKSVVHIAPDHPTVLIGRRPNPPRHKRLLGQSHVYHIAVAENAALAQVAAGADVVNVSVAGPDPEQTTLLPRAIEAVQEAIETPISIEAADPETLAATLAACRGKPLVNAVTGARRSLSQILPLVADHGAALIGRCEDEEGIPDDPYGRLEIACRIIEQAEGLGIPRQDMLIDCMTQAIEADPEAALITLETVRLVRKELETNMTLDISAISVELPNCKMLQQALLTAAIPEGVNAPIVNVARDRQTVLAMDAILGRDESIMRYMRYYHAHRSGMRNLVDWEMLGW
jgi:5-methyltetrahydrofolate--homocysteine methyltransferase